MTESGIFQKTSFTNKMLHQHFICNSKDLFSVFKNTFLAFYFKVEFKSRTQNTNNKPVNGVKTIKNLDHLKGIIF